MRLFVGVELGAEVVAGAAAALETGRKVAPRAKWVRAENLHLTLAFLGSVHDDRVPAIETALATVAERHGPLSLHVAGSGGFGSSRKPRVLWLGVTGEVEALGRIQVDLEEALAPLGYQAEHREFRPHLTLARARDPRGDVDLAAAVAALAGEELGDASIDRLILFRSDLSPQGPKYTEVASVPLGGR